MIRTILGRIQNSDGIGLDLGQYIGARHLTYHGNLSLDTDFSKMHAVITENELKSLLTDLEADYIERTTSVSNMD